MKSRMSVFLTVIRSRFFFRSYEVDYQYSFRSTFTHFWISAIHLILTVAAYTGICLHIRSRYRYILMKNIIYIIWVWKITLWRVFSPFNFLMCFPQTKSLYSRKKEKKWSYISKFIFQYIDFKQLWLSILLLPLLPPLPTFQCTNATNIIIITADIPKKIFSFGTILMMKWQENGIYKESLKTLYWEKVLCEMSEQLYPRGDDPGFWRLSRVKGCEGR